MPPITFTAVEQRQLAVLADMGFNPESDEIMAEHAKQLIRHILSRKDLIASDLDEAFIVNHWREHGDFYTALMLAIQDLTIDDYGIFQCIVTNPSETNEYIEYTVAASSTEHVRQLLIDHCHEWTMGEAAIKGATHGIIGEVEEAARYTVRGPAGIITFTHVTGD